MNAAVRVDDATLLKELEPEAERLLERHLSTQREWMPHEYVPWSQARDFDTEPWTPDQSRLDGPAQAAFEVNLLTEDNLPSYHREVFQLFGTGDGAWINWVHRWTAEEGRHSIVLRDYLLATRAIDPEQLERNRMQVMSHGYDYGKDHDSLRGMAYVSFQELATRVSHRNTGRYSRDPVADRIMARIAADENLHLIFYRDAVDAAAHVDVNRMVEAVAEEVLGFEMPGADGGIPGYRRKAVQIAMAGIYDLRVHRDDVVVPLLRHWNFFDLEGLDARAEAKRQEVAAHLERLDEQATRFEQRREERAARAA